MTTPECRQPPGFYWTPRGMHHFYGLFGQTDSPSSPKSWDPAWEPSPQASPPQASPSDITSSSESTSDGEESFQQRQGLIPQGRTRQGRTRQGRPIRQVQRPVYLVEESHSPRGVSLSPQERDAALYKELIGNEGRINEDDNTPDDDHEYVDECWECTALKAENATVKAENATVKAELAAVKAELAALKAEKVKALFEESDSGTES
jgi:hypothetical protein